MKKKILQSIAVLTIILVGVLWGAQTTHSITTVTPDITVSDSPDPFSPSAGQNNVITIKNIGELECERISLEIQATERIWNWENVAPGGQVSASWDGKNDEGDLVLAGEYTYMARCMPLPGYIHVDHETGEITVESSSAKQPSLYGLFIGTGYVYSSSESGLRDDLVAANLYHSFSNMSNVAYKRILLGDETVSGKLTKNDIKNAIYEIGDKMKKGDMFVLYIGGHGGPNKSSDETTLTKEDEVVTINNRNLDNALTDDDLRAYLNRLKDFDKLILIDACHSGGFWGNNNPSDIGDLEKLNKTGMLASAPEGIDGWYDSQSGLSYFGQIVNNAWKKVDGHLAADTGKKDGIINFAELALYLKQEENFTIYIDSLARKTYFDDGELTPFRVEMFNTISKKTDDFNEDIQIEPSSNTNIKPEIYPIANGGGPYEGSQDYNLLFDAGKSTDEDGSIVKYEWDWDNDGSYDENSSSPSIEHTWDAPLSEGIVGLQVTDDDGLASTDKILVNVSSKTICSTLTRDKRFDFLDTFRLKSEKNEKVTVRLKPNENGEYTNGRATLILWPGIHQFRKEKGNLPLQLNATLPRSGWYDISVLRKFGKKGFAGDYCITLESSGDAWQTLKATRNVE